MIGFSPGLYWTICWRFIAPVFLLFIIVFGLYHYEPLTNGDYEYPMWANVLGWCIAGSSMIMIPGMATYKMLTTKGTFLEVKSVCRILDFLLTYFQIKFTILEIEIFDDACERSANQCKWRCDG